MKTRVLVFISGCSGRWPEIAHILTGCGCEQWVRKGPSLTGNYYGYLYETDSRLPGLRATLKAKGVRWSERREHVYTVSELRAAPFLCLTVNRAPRDTGYPMERSQYDFSRACPECGTGAIQVSPLLARSSALPKKSLICQTMDYDYLVRTEVAHTLRQGRVTGLELRRVQCLKNRKPLDWWQLISSYGLPPIAPETKGVAQGDPEPCSHCNRDSYFGNTDEPMEIVYSRSAVDPGSLPDCVHTWERFGKSVLAEHGQPFKYSRFAHPLLLVKPKAFGIFRDQKVRGVEFVPVEIR